MPRQRAGPKARNGFFFVFFFFFFFGKKNSGTRRVRKWWFFPDLGYSLFIDAIPFALDFALFACIVLCTVRHRTGVYKNPAKLLCFFRNFIILNKRQTNYET